MGLRDDPLPNKITLVFNAKDKEAAKKIIRNRVRRDWLIHLDQRLIEGKMVKKIIQRFKPIKEVSLKA